jgi:modulator of FtsH protease HflK
MAWNEPGGSKDPWGNRGGRGTGPNNGSELAEVWKQLVNQLRALFGLKPSASGGGSSASGSNNNIIWVVIGIAIALWAAIDSFHVVDARQRGVVLRFGKFSRQLLPGAQFTWPRPIESVTLLDVMQVRSINNEVHMLTKDENLVTIDYAVQYTINDARAFLFEVSEPEETLGQASEAAIREVVGARPVDEILVGNRAEMSEKTKQKIQYLMETVYKSGISVTGVNFQDATVPKDVKGAFDDANKAVQNQEQMANDARAYSFKILPIARGDAAQILQNAEAYKQSLVIKATGDADRFNALVAQYKVAPELMRKRLYLETMQDVLAKNPKVIVDSKSGGNNMMVLPLEQLMKAASERRAATEAAATAAAQVPAMPANTAAEGGQ